MPAKISSLYQARRLAPRGPWARTRARRWGCAALFALLTAGAGASAWASAPSGGGPREGAAEQDRRARLLYADAEAHFTQRRYRSAIALYEAAYELRQLPGFLFNIAQCYRMLGDFERAVVFFERYLGRYPNSPHSPQIERLLTELRPKAVRQRAEMRAGMPGGREAAGSAAAPPATTAGGSRAHSVASPHPSDRVESSPAGRTALLWSGVGLTAALLTAGLVTGQLASNRFDEHDDPQTAAADRPQLKDSAESLRAASIATFSAAGVTAIATALYYWLGRGSGAAGKPDVSSAVGVGAAPLSGGGALLVTGRY